jgi:hypothetical protein
MPMPDVLFIGGFIVSAALLWGLILYLTREDPQKPY